MQYRLIQMDYFDVDVIIITGKYKKVEDFLEHIDFKGEYGPREVAQGCTISTEPGYLIWVKDKNNKGVVAHEIFHCIDSILRDRGMELSDDSDEVWAYGIQYLTEQYYFKPKALGLTALEEQ